MEFLAPLGPVYQAGTLSGNPLAMAAGIATVGHLIEKRSRCLCASGGDDQGQSPRGVAQIAATAGVAMTTNRVGSMWTWFFTGHAVRDFATAATSDTEVFGRFHRGMMEAGVWLPPSQFEAAFLSNAHGQAEVDWIMEAARRVLTPL